MIVQYSLSDKKSNRIAGVQFGIMKDKDIERLSVVEVNDVNIYHRGIPQKNGINDTRMGTVDRRTSPHARVVASVHAPPPVLQACSVPFSLPYANLSTVARCRHTVFDVRKRR